MNPLLTVDLTHGSVVTATEALPVMQNSRSQPVLLLLLLLLLLILRSEHPSTFHLQRTSRNCV
jgi:hypothetical protein